MRTPTPVRVVLSLMVLRLERGEPSLLRRRQHLEHLRAQVRMLGHHLRA